MPVCTVSTLLNGNFGHFTANQIISQRELGRIIFIKHDRSMRGIINLHILGF